jgi:signal transduction histidine kinase
MTKDKLEKDILQYGLLVGIGYQLYQTLMSIVPTLSINLVLTNMLITLVIFFIYLLVQRKGAQPLLLLALHFVALAGLTFFWKNYGGISGTVPSFFCFYVSFIIVCSRGVTQWIIISILISVFAGYFLFPASVGMESIAELSKISLVQRNIDYLTVAVLIVAITLYMKRKFDFYRDRVSKKHQQLNQIAKTLHNQNLELATRQEETRAINENLEAMVEERALQIGNKNSSLAEYAFINAHMLRGPLCRIIGLINLMEQNPGKYSNGQLQQLKSIAQEIDLRIKEINSVVS